MSNQGRLRDLDRNQVWSLLSRIHSEILYLDCISIRSGGRQKNLKLKYLESKSTAA